MASTEEPTVEAAASKKEVGGEQESATAAAAEDEDTGAQVAPIVKLQEVAVTTGEENENVLLNLKCKLYRFDKEGNQWKERGVGTVKLLEHKETGKVRLVMRQSKTLKICANHLVIPSITIQEHAGNDKSCVWHAADFADGELKEETFCIRFPSVEDCKSFKQTFKDVSESQVKRTGETEEDNTAANLIQKLSVGEKDQEEKPEVKEASATEEKKDGNQKDENSADEK